MLLIKGTSVKFLSVPWCSGLHAVQYACSKLSKVGACWLMDKFLNVLQLFDVLADAAAEEKNRLEELQRSVRKDRKKVKDDLTPLYAQY